MAYEVQGRLLGGWREEGGGQASPQEMLPRATNVGGTHQRLRVVPGKVSSIILLHNRLCYLYVVLFV